MTILVAGVLAFTLVHLYPSVLAGSRETLAERLGENAYRSLFSIVIVASLVLIIVGWGAATPAAVYNPPLGQSPVTTILMITAFVLFVAARAPTNIKRYVRHPQMLSVILFSLAHLLTNGDTRSILLFGGLGIWAVLEILFCNRRDGEWKRPEPKPLIADAITVAIGAIVFFVVLYFHGPLFGVVAAPFFS